MIPTNKQARRAGTMLLAALALGMSACGTDDDSAADGGLDSGADTDTGTGTDTVADAGFLPDPQRIYDDIAVLASEEYEGRMAGTAGGAKALEFVEARFQELGLVPAGDDGTFRQAFAMQGWGLTADPAVSVAGNALAYPDDFSVFEFSASADRTGEMVFAGYGISVSAYDQAQYPDCPLPASGYSDYKGVSMTGKIAVILRHGPNDDEAINKGCPAPLGLQGALWDHTVKTWVAYTRGARAVIFVNDYAEDGEHYVGGVSSSYTPPVPVVSVDRGVIEAAVPDLQAWAAAIDADLAPNPHATGVAAAVSVKGGATNVVVDNAVAAIPGADPVLKSEVVVVGAHLDHLGMSSPMCPDGLCPGADDNASGTATMLELARDVVESVITPARTIVFVGFNAEEEGLYGSTFYATAGPAYPIEDTVAMFSVDMVGMGDGEGLELYGATSATDPDASWLADIMAGAAATKGLPWQVELMAPIDASDHAPFAKVGVPAALAMSHSFEDGDHTTYHTVDDTIDDISLEVLQGSAELLWVALEPLALGTEDDYVSSAKALPPSPLRPSRLAVHRRNSLSLSR
ncbi:MAG: M20/M25/M40 family metallo-hydrolase [Deltaproteobacteria bacterium]|nr:M20/M25/M40 family metallo-hydrolase [Deltaproteobacteria bacterium]